jgi:hypothetical protein
MDEDFLLIPSLIQKKKKIFAILWHLFKSIAKPMRIPSHNSCCDSLKKAINPEKELSILSVYKKNFQ